MFVAGAIAGFNVMGLLAEEALSRTNPIDRRGDRVLAGVLDWFGVGAAVGAASLLAEIHGWVPWLLGPLAATELYLVMGSLQLAVVAARSKPGPK